MLCSQVLGTSVYPTEHNLFTYRSSGYRYGSLSLTELTEAQGRYMNIVPAPGTGGLMFTDAANGLRNVPEKQRKCEKHCIVVLN